MAPAKFQIYVDEDAQQTDNKNKEAPPAPPTKPSNGAPPPKAIGIGGEQQQARYKPDNLMPSQRFYFDERKIYPVGEFGSELSFEELRFKRWQERKKKLREDQVLNEIEALKRENQELKNKFSSTHQDEVYKENEELRLDNQELRKDNQDLIKKVNILTQQNQMLTQQNQMLTQQQQMLTQQNQMLTQQNQMLTQQQQQQHQQAIPSTIPSGLGSQGNRLSILPQCFQQTQTLEFNETSVNGAPTIVHDLWSGTFAANTTTFANNDKLTYPIDQSQFIRDNIETSTPKSKEHNNKQADNNNGAEKRASFASRRLSRPSIGGSPTLKLSPIVETSRDCNSKSSSSSSGMSATPGTTQKNPQVTPSVAQPEKPIDPADPTSYNRLLACLNEPIARQGVFRYSRNLPRIRPGQTCIKAGQDEYLIDQELSAEGRLYGAMLMDDDSNESTMNVPMMKMCCLKIDQPANEWLFYICKELHRRLVRQRCQPDIELSVMNANPAIFFKDGSILVDEYLRLAPLSRFLEACEHQNKQFPKSVAALITLELLQVVKQIHACNIIHMSLNVNNLFIANSPNRDDITSINDRTSIIKLLGFDRAMDMRFLPEGSQFESRLDDMMICQMQDSRPWSYEIDWFGALDCIHKMFFHEPLQPIKDNQSQSWYVNSPFKGCPTSVWPSMFRELLNVPKPIIDPYIDELSTWVKANINFVLKEVVSLESILDEFNKATQPNRTMTA